jgi:uridine phosphorylase
MSKIQPAAAPILTDKLFSEPSVFTAQGLLDGARRQKGLVPGHVPPVCVLDPDVDLTRHLRTTGRASPDPLWACYHTELLRMPSEPLDIGFIGGAVGAPFAVLVAEQLFASGCRLLISMTSAGQLRDVRPPPYYIMIDRALRDEGTSYHYESAARFSDAPAKLLELMSGAFDHLGIGMVTGPTWTTDAPFRETATLIKERRGEGLLAVEMEAAALYALARKRDLPILCFALVTNQMATSVNDFDKGAANGVDSALAVIAAVVARWSRIS